MDNTLFHFHSSFTAKGDQPKAIAALSQGIKEGKKAQVLLGVTGSGKTFTMANVIAQSQKPALILAHNKTLAAQLYQEFKQFFPENAVEYFVSYYDYYQPEAYIARTDTYIEKEMQINDQIDRMRLSATRSLLERKDVIIVASVSCIYGLGLPEYYGKMQLILRRGEKKRRDEILIQLVQMHYKRSDLELARASFRSRGDCLEIVPAYEEKLAYRIQLFDEEIESISAIDPLTGKRIVTLEEVRIFPGSHHVTPEEIRFKALDTITQELQERAIYFENNKRLLERQRILERTKYDMEMIREVGFCKGIENYSRHFSGKLPGNPPACLIDYFPADFLLFIDESHQTIPQIRAMYNGDRARKESLVEFGFRLPSAFDNRPLKFEEFYTHMHQVVYVSATPSNWEIEEAGNLVVEQIIRPTGLLDPEIEVKPATHQVDDALEHIRRAVEENKRVLVTTLTKKLAEDLTRFLREIDVKAEYLHSDIETLTRVQILNDLRTGKFDVLVGINLLREGLDLPEVALVVILDGDKQGFLRSQTALIQTCGRAARNAQGRVVIYADVLTPAIQATLHVTEKRRALQQAYNKEHGITPKTTLRQSLESLSSTFGEEKREESIQTESLLSAEEIIDKIEELEKEMRKAAKQLHFEEAARLRDLKQHYQEKLLEM